MKVKAAQESFLLPSALSTVRDNKQSCNHGVTHTTAGPTDVNAAPPKEKSHPSPADKSAPLVSAPLRMLRIGALVPIGNGPHRANWSHDALQTQTR
jgi:hypothetical protein